MKYGGMVELGRHEGLKIPWAVMPVRVRVPVPLREKPVSESFVILSLKPVTFASKDKAEKS